MAGIGYKKCTICSGSGNCKTCKGTGSGRSLSCSRCGGSGYIDEGGDNDTPTTTLPTIVKASSHFDTLEIGHSYPDILSAGNVFEQLASVKDGTSPYTWSVVSGNLPDGISIFCSDTLNTSELNQTTSNKGQNLTLRGIPVRAGTYSFTLKVTDKNGNTATKGFSVAVTGEYIEQPSSIQVSAENFPDAIFRAYVSEKFDTDGDGTLSGEEINAVTEIDVSDKGISSLKGVEYFTALTELYCDDNQLTELDVSKNTALTELICRDNQLIELDVSKNTALTQLECNMNELTLLDVFENANLVQLECSVNQLTDISLGVKPKLQCFWCEENLLTRLDVSGCPKLPPLGTVDVSLAFGIVAFLADEGVTILRIKINAANFPDAIFRAYISTNFDTDSNGVLSDEEISAVTEISVSSKGISSLKGVEYFTALTELDCENNQLTELDVSKNTALWELICGYNQITTLDVSNNHDLFSLCCNNNQLTELDISNNTALFSLYCEDNQLTELDVSNNHDLYLLCCCDNQLTELDVSKNTALAFLNCGYNQLNTLDVSNNSALASLYCNNNQLTALDVSNNFALWLLYCDNNQLTSLRLGNNSVLYVLKCENNNLTRIDISGCPKLASGTFTHDDTVSIIDGSSTLHITTSSLASGTVGTTYTQTLEADGYTVIPDDDGNAYWTLTGGSIPGGLTLSSTGVISGTPTASGSYTFTVKAEYDGNSDTKSFTIQIAAAPQPTYTLTITKTSLASGTVNTPYSDTLTAQLSGGTDTITWAASGLPSWLSLNSSTGALTGTPTAEGSYSFTVNAQAGENTSASKEFTVIIAGLASSAQPAFKSASLILSGQIGVNFFLDLPNISGVNYYDGNTCWMDFDINGDSTTNPPQLVDDEFMSNGRYGFRCYVNSVQMADPI